MHPSRSMAMIHEGNFREKNLLRGSSRSGFSVIAPSS